MRMRRTRWITPVLATALLLAGCGGDEGTEQLPASTIPAAATAATTEFDVLLMGNEEGNIRLADLYALTLNPLRVYRVTTDKRVSSMSAGLDQIVVAAADQQIDLLGLVDVDGTIKDIPGLGRPSASGPQLQRDGTIRYFDYEGPAKEPTRYLSWDPASGRQRVLHTAPESGYVGFIAGAGRSFLQLAEDEDGPAVLVVGPGKTRKIQLPGLAGVITLGKQFLATEIVPDLPGIDFPEPTGLQLINPSSGKRTVVTGWTPISWSPDGTELLVRRTGTPAGQTTELGLLNPADPQAVRPLGTIPYLGIYQGSWVRGAPA